MLPSVSFRMFSAYYSSESLRSSDILGPKVIFHFKVDHRHVLVATRNYEGSEIILGESCFVGPQQVFDNIEFPYLLLPLTMQNYIHDMLTRLQIPPSDIDGLKQLISTYAYQRALNCRERRSRVLGIVIDLTVQFKEYYVEPRSVEEELEELEADILMDIDGDEAFFSFVPPASPLPASIHTLKVTKFGDTEDDHSSSSSSSIESCTICMDELVRGVDIACLPCSHIFHSECIVKWLENKNSCPLCRFVMPTQH